MGRIELEHLVQGLQERTKRLVRRQVRFLAGASVLLTVFILSGWQSERTPQENLKTHALSIIDKNGVVRLSPATGIVFNDSAGNERGGMAMLDDGSTNFCFDDPKTERNCLFFMPKFGNGVAFNDANGDSRAILYLDTNGDPHLLLRDERGHPLVSLPEPSNHSDAPR